LSEIISKTISFRCINC